MNTLDYYLSLPWTIRRTAENDDGAYISLRIAELPGFIVAGRTAGEIEEQFWPALEIFLKSYLEEGEVPPQPEGTTAVEPPLQGSLFPDPGTSYESAPWSRSDTFGDPKSAELRFAGLTSGRRLAVPNPS